MKNTPKAKAYDSLTQVIDQMVADRLDRGTIESLRSMLDFEAFQPIRTVIENKIIEIGNFLKSKETPVAPPIDVWMGNVQKVQIESNEEEKWAPFEYENDSDVREAFNNVKERYPDLEFDVTLPPVDNH